MRSAQLPLPSTYVSYAPMILRLGLSIVFLWFGITQLVNPESFLGYIPQWLYPHPLDMMHEHPLQMFHQLPLTPHLIIMGNGIIEIILGGMLLLGLLTRIVALLLMGHLLVIMLGLGYNDIAVRDFGLFIATLSVFLHGPDQWCVDFRLQKT
ncbi:DoxX family membrane protein [Candidatus Woesearchaeota archaeon]|nr:DoxX family membrane protein [Candidatus Woesearchaeota archaeon]